MHMKILSFADHRVETEMPTPSSFVLILQRDCPPIFGSALAPFALIMANAGSEMPAIASFVSEELAQVIRLYWDAGPSKRMAVVEVDSLLSSGSGRWWSVRTQGK
jgi:hypothetical protein